jgi:hypothetical protein
MGPLFFSRRPLQAKVSRAGKNEDSRGQVPGLRKNRPATFPLHLHFYPPPQLRLKGASRTILAVCMGNFRFNKTVKPKIFRIIPASEVRQSIIITITDKIDFKAEVFRLLPLQAKVYRADKNEDSRGQVPGLRKNRPATFPLHLHFYPPPQLRLKGASRTILAVCMGNFRFNKTVKPKIFRIIPASEVRQSIIITITDKIDFKAEVIRLLPLQAKVYRADKNEDSRGQVPGLRKNRPGTCPLHLRGGSGRPARAARRRGRSRNSGGDQPGCSGGETSPA